MRREGQPHEDMKYIPGAAFPSWTRPRRNRQPPTCFWRGISCANSWPEKKDYIEAGGEFIVPIPRPLVINKANYERFAEGGELPVSGRAGRLPDSGLRHRRPGLDRRLGLLRLGIRDVVPERGLPSNPCGFLRDEVARPSDRLPNAPHKQPVSCYQPISSVTGEINRCTQEYE